MVIFVIMVIIQIKKAKGFLHGLGIWEKMHIFMACATTCKTLFQPLKTLGIWALFFANCRIIQTWWCSKLSWLLIYSLLPVHFAPWWLIISSEHVGMELGSSSNTWTWLIQWCYHGYSGMGCGSLEGFGLGGSTVKGSIMGLVETFPVPLF